MSHRPVQVCIGPFLAAGGLRTVNRMRQRDEKTGLWHEMVAKQFMDDRGDAKRWCEGEIAGQVLSKHYADLFNQEATPKKIDFITPYIIELHRRPDKPLYNCEVLMTGEAAYAKHNSNYGAVIPDATHGREDAPSGAFVRSTPQAFSHYTFVKSDKKMVVCDIQGVHDLYTDPQVHTFNRRRFGRGNCGADGMCKFLATHKCNEVCEALHLPPLQVTQGELTVVCPEAATEVRFRRRSARASGQRVHHYKLDVALQGQKIGPYHDGTDLVGPDGQVHCWQVPHDAQPGRSYSFAIDVVQPESCPFKEYEFGDISRAIGGEIAVRLAEAL